MFERFARSWDLAGACWRLLMQDKTLLLFPLMSLFALGVILVTFAVPLLPLFAYLFGAHAASAQSPIMYVLLFIFYWIQFSVVIFFNTALVEVALKRFDGETAGIADGMRRAWSRIGIIVTYALIAATVGIVLRYIAERVGILGRIIVGLIGFAWSIATALVVPVLAAEDVGPVEAIQRSVQLIKKAWGEDVIGSVGIGFIFGFVTFLLILLGIFCVILAVASHAFGIAIALGLLFLIAIGVCALAQTTMQGIYSAALYRYADGDSTSGIDKALLASAFRPRT